MNDTRRGDDFGYGLIAHHGRENKCFECGKWTKGMHHVVPVCRGGTKQVPMCQVCHGKAHDYAGVLPSMIREGLAKAKAKGVKFGAPIKLTDDATKTILKLRSQGKSIRVIAEELRLSVGTVQKVTSNPEGQEFFTKTMVFKDVQ